MPVVTKKNNLSLAVNYRDEEVFFLSDVILTAFDFSTRSHTGSETTLANNHLEVYGGQDKEEELERHFRSPGWEAGLINYLPLL